ncbi:MAG: endonuclease MutS2 [Clostridia bacterium]|nr:endonuclease MutS2 [Clostridia bacterium]
MNEKTLRVLEYGKVKNMLANEVSSALGRSLVDALQPLDDYDEVVQVMAETSEIAEVVVKASNIPMGPIFDLKESLKMAEIGATLSIGQLLRISDSMRTARLIKQFIKGMNEDGIKYPILFGRGESISTYKRIEDEINRAIISESEISDQASPALYKIRREIEKANSDIRKKLDNLIHASSSQKYLQDAIITIRQDRFVVPVKSEHKHSVKGLVHDQSSSGATLYIEPMAVVELNNKLKELRLEEKAEIERILGELTGLVSEVTEGLRINQQTLAYLDFLIGKGKLSLRMRGMAPEFNQRGYLRFRNARHPLIAAKEVVANTIWLGNEFRTLLITGPNTGGKTVTLKTLGLLTLMAQSGLHIPVDYGSELCVFKNIFADIGDEQSIEQSLSTFSSHMTNIVNLLEKADEHSLVLLDELGAGTDPTEGAALAMSILSYLHSSNVKTLATTHYSELKHFALVNEGIENACVEFDVATLRPTYKLLIGVPGKSNAFEISSKLGLKDDIIEHAKIFLDKDNIEFEDILTSIEESRREAEKERDEAVKLRLEVESLKDKLSNREEKLANQREKILKDAKEEARTLLKKAKDESDEIIRSLRGLETAEQKQRNKEIEAMRKKMRDNLSSVGSSAFDEMPSNFKAPKSLKVGDQIKLVKLNQEGTVASEVDSNGQFMAQVGIMKVSVNIKDTMLLNDHGQVEKQTKKSAKQYGSKTMHVSTEVDLRGMNVEEAIVILDKYIDDAYLSNLESVRIIHGKGTGALKSGLKDYFKRHPHVKSFRDGEFGEGGHGVTVLSFK